MMPDEDSTLMSALSDHAANINNPAPAEQPKPAVEAPKKEEAQPKVEPAEPKTLKDKLGAVEEIVEEKEEPVTEEEIPTYKGRVPTDKEKASWASLKREAAELKEFKTKYSELENKVKELEKSPLSEEVRTKLEHAEKVQAAYDMRNSPEYLKAVTEPKEAISADVAEIASTFGLNEDALWKAFAETNSWKRGQAIDKAIQGAEQEISPSVVAAIRDNAERMHGVWRKESELESKASEIKTALDARSKDTQQKMSLEQEQAWSKATAESQQMLETKLAPVLKGLPEAERASLVEALKTAKISEDPGERALQAQAPHIAAIMIQRYNAQAKAMAELKKENAALLKSRPGTTVTQEPEARTAKSDSEEDEDFLNELKSAKMPSFA